MGYWLKYWLAWPRDNIVTKRENCESQGSCHLSFGTQLDKSNTDLEHQLETRVGLHGKSVLMKVAGVKQDKNVETLNYKDEFHNLFLRNRCVIFC